MRDRLLVRHFLWRFLEHDLVSPDSDRRGILSAAGGTLAAVSLFIAVLVAWFYQLANTMPAGFTSIQSLDDRFLFSSSSMLVASGDFTSLTSTLKTAALPAISGA